MTVAGEKLLHLFPQRQMLSLRFLRHAGRSAQLRSLTVPRSSSASLIRLARPTYPSRAFSSSIQRFNSANSNTPNADAYLDAPADSSASSGDTVTSQALPGRVEPKLSLTFTCTVEDCGTRSTHEFTKRSYERGIVLVECPGCHNRHLIADHLGWFKESTEEGKLRTVEDLVRAKGEKVRRGRVGQGGAIEYFE
ncbi:hypothetical protein AX16_005909 [Volvariella volvacea WC 439]|nr:hypothetical protein AX16_005909 [Volvariella volvacea WC 439]